jgi:hypothetical protein
MGLADELERMYSSTRVASRMASFMAMACGTFIRPQRAAKQPFMQGSRKQMEHLGRASNASRLSSRFGPWNQCSP